jgi:transcriptional regulator with GAF, ATPase, and Fis domain/tetratricopeptide (TPR) repeat protein
MAKGLVNGRYELLSPIAAGANAQVFRARDASQDGAERALKVIPRSADPAQLAWEFARLSALSHPHLPRVHDLDCVRSGPLPEGAVFLVEDLVRGQPCDQALAGDRTRPLLRLLAEAASALGYLHARGLLHRDVSPRNLLIDENGSARLIDLGLGAQQGAAGTPAYMAPEALAGVASARSDLYSLGATAWQVAAGQPPHQGEGAELVRSILEREVPPPAGIDAELARIIARLCARDPAARHASAALLLSDLARLSDLELPVPEPPRGEAAAGVLVGRDAELGRLCTQLERLARGEPTAPVVVVAGAPGSGRSRLCAEALRRLRLLAAAGRLPAVEVITRGQLAVTAPTEEARQVLLLEALAARAPAILHLPDASFAELRLAQRALGGLDGALLLVEHEQAVAGAENVVLAPLGETEVARLCEAEFGRPARPEFVHAVLSAAGGLPLGVHELCAAAWPEGDAADVKALGGAGLRERANRQLLALPAEARRLVIALALAEGPLLPAQALAIADAPPDALARLSEQGAVVADGNFIALATQAHVEAARAAADRPLTERVLAATTAPKARARLLAALGRTRDAAAAHLDAGLGARDALDLPAAAEHLRAAVEGGETRARLPLAEVLVDRGEYTAALAELDRLPPSDPEVARTRARALQRGGDARAAEAALRAALGDHDDPAVRELLGRLLLARGAFAEARTLGAGLEVEGLAALYQGDHGRADECFRALFATAKDDLGRARALVLLGNAAHVASRFSDAAEHFAQALALAARTGDVHTSAPAAGSLAAAKKELGDYAGALEPMRQAVRDLARLGQTSWYGAALGNLGSLLLALGDLTAAERVAARAREEATRRSTPLLAAIAALTEGDVLRRRGRPRDALAAYGSAEETFAKAGEATYKLAARRGRALALADLGRAGEASPIIADLPDDSDTQLARARIALLNRDPATAAIAAEKAAAALAAESRIGERWRADAVLARALARTRKFAPAREALARARKTFEEIRMKTPEIYRTSMADDPDAQLFRDEAPRAAPDARYRRLIALNKRLNSELRLSRLLELILDAVIEFTDAERGFLLLANKKGELAVELARNIDQRTINGPGDASEFQVSRSIAERAAREGQPIVTIDAQGDERFAAALSVSDLRLRSVLAAPLRVKGRVVGTIYVDNRLRKSAFGDQDVALVLDFADQAAIAIDNARLLKELRRARTKAEDLAAELATRVEKREAEIRDIRVELASSREALQVRYDYQNLIGRTPRMLDLFRLLDRVTETELPVVIYGESGTGKELAARAIHHNGRRRELPFVSENCAAIPETLLESTLFGYVRGAFTGADRDARGLFEIADGGTLFLDEVGEMSPAMQTKLLRVLQDGEFRRIGGERPRKVDVRIIAASNRRLQDLVKEGKFREDLFYRLNVVTVEMPPLRERCEDVPLLVDHFLRKQSGTPKKVSAESMARLCGYAWPGNVRELENEIVRAAALAEGAINLSDLSPRIAAAGEEAPESPDDLRMKARVERLERSLLREALGRASGNQTRAARLLGLSRFGLQKKLKRYRIK